MMMEAWVGVVSLVLLFAACVIIALLALRDRLASAGEPAGADEAYARELTVLNLVTAGAAELPREAHAYVETAETDMFALRLRLDLDDVETDLRRGLEMTLALALDRLGLAGAS